jgi:G:T-mismatch repair DNA endonuclease (very short patch repair protein)
MPTGIYIRIKPVWNKGKSSWSKGRHLSEEHRKKIGLANKGKTCRKGYHHSQETKDKLRVKKLGTFNPMYGKKHSIKWKENQKLIARNNPNYGMRNKHHNEITRSRITNKLIGIKQSEESKRKRSSTLKQYYLNHKHNRLGKDMPQSYLEWRKHFVLPKKDTSIEVKIQNYLKQLGVEFLTHQYIKDIEHGYQCDILIPSKKCVIECFGDYWHSYPLSRKIDIIRCQELRNSGYKVLVFWENEIRVMEVEDLRNKFEQCEII